ncbi:PLAC8-domain-containing protein [Trichodelitschia bisporula]|uniref:PLAC8-domain-containing protein n=1 Tax=Trichodelitschia bisporula TaxID=703511 RepID=A0A6G1I147_9PEZI|nr:PLAC8-domain-containing protein [Trichodelitschia bisporula]
MSAQQEWHASGADCCSPLGTCCMSWFLPCVVYGRVHHRMHKDSQLQNWSMFNGDCFGYYALTCCGFQWILQMMQRGELRQKYGLKGSGCTDCLCACCCTPCDLAQQDKEAEFRENEKAGLINVQPNKMDNMQYGS